MERGYAKLWAQLWLNRRLGVIRRLHSLNGVTGSSAPAVLVVQLSRVELDEARGAAIAEIPLPVVIVNAKDAPAARVFTLFHELTHIALRLSGLCDIEEDFSRRPEEQRVEVFCNAAAASALVPSRDLLAIDVVRDHGKRTEWSDPEIDRICRHFAVSRFVVLRRLLTLGRTTQAFYRERHVIWSAEAARIAALQEDRDVIIPPYRKALSATGKEFARLVLRAYREDHITLSDVSEYMRLKIKHIPELERRHLVDLLPRHKRDFGWLG